MAIRKKSWQEKLRNNGDLPQLVTLTPQQEKKWGKGKMVIPAPVDVNAVMKRVPSGKLITINKIREKLAKKYHADLACPITTGIFSWIAAHAADEAVKEGKKNTTPYWRTLKAGGVINEKYPGGIEEQALLLEGEGHHVIQKGKKWVVADFEKRLVK